jgi:ribonuclease HI
MSQLKTSTVRIYCDGACLGNPGPGGWSALLITEKNNQEHEKTLSGHAKNTTNNRMELTAVIKALEALKRSCSVHLYSDSQYVVKGMTEWSKKWIKNEWKSASRKPIINQDLWQELIKASAKHQIEWHWVKGHSGHPQNERVDQLARLAAHL